MLDLLVRLRRQTAAPAPPEGLPAEALAQPERRRHFNRRRERDPLGEGHPCTWRPRVIKVAAEVTTNAVRVLVRLSDPNHYVEISDRIPLRPG